MANVVDILVRANTTQATSGMKSFTKELNTVVQGLTGFSLSGMGAAAAVVAVGNEIKKAVGEYGDYATAMGKAAELTGITAEEMSRLTQAADDAFVSQEALTRSFQLALKNGFVPTIDNLAKLSDELLAMKDPAERAEKAAKIFGRGWAEIAPFLLKGGDAIRANTAAIEDGLIVTDEAVAQNIKYKESLDAWNDSITAAKNGFVSELLPAITKVLDIMNQLPKTTDKTTDAWLRLAYAIPGLGLVLQITDSQFELNKQQQEEWRLAVENSGAAARAMPDQLGPMNEALANSAVSAETGQSALTFYTNALGGMGAQIVQMNTDIAKAQQDVSAAQAEWSGGVAQQAVGLLDEQRIGTENYQDALSAIDDVMGTSLLTQDQMKTRLEEINKEYAKSGDLEAYKTALMGVKDQFMPMAEKVQAATDKVIELEKKLKQLDGMRVNVLIDIQQQGGFTLPGGAGAPVPPGGSTPVPPYRPPGGAPAQPLPGGPLSGTSTTVVVNNNVDASKVAAQIALAIQRRK